MVESGCLVVCLGVPGTMAPRCEPSLLETLSTRRTGRPFDVRYRQEINRVRRFRMIVEMLDAGEYRGRMVKILEDIFTFIYPSALTSDSP